MTWPDDVSTKSFMSSAREHDDRRDQGFAKHRTWCHVFISSMIRMFNSSAFSHVDDIVHPGCWYFISDKQHDSLSAICYCCERIALNEIDRGITRRSIVPTFWVEESRNVARPPTFFLSYCYSEEQIIRSVAVFPFVSLSALLFNRSSQNVRTGLWGPIRKNQVSWHGNPKIRSLIPPPKKNPFSSGR